MNQDDLQKYNDLCGQMQRLSGPFPSKDDPLLGHQLFLCHDLEAPLSEVEWSKFIATTDGNLPKEKAAWEHWERFPDLTGCSRYYGLGSNDEELKEFRDMLDRGAAILAEYEELDLPEALLWDLPNLVRLVSPLPGHLRLLELICRETGHHSECGGNPNLEVIENDDLFTAVGEATWNWVGNREVVIESGQPTTRVKTVSTVTINIGDRCYVLDSGATTVVVPIEFTKFFSGFVQKVLNSAPGEAVPWSVLNEAVPGGSEAIPSSGVASAATRKVKHELNRRMLELGRPPDSTQWIRRDRRGYCLNTSCAWQLGKELLKQLKPSARVRTTIDPLKMARHTPDKDE